MGEKTKHTAGPWRWMFRGDEVTLVHPGHGHLTVMDFVRRGFNAATFRLATWKGDERENMGGIMVPAHQLDVANHPDARLIAAAPDLLAACVRARARLAEDIASRLNGFDSLIPDAIAGNPDVAALDAAIAKAEGGAS